MRETWSLRPMRTVITEVDKLRREWKELGSGLDIPVLLGLLSDQVPMEAR